MPVLPPRSVYRKYVTDGVPSSGSHRPVKKEVVQLLNSLFGLAGSGLVTVGTLPDLTAITPDGKDFGGVVLDDPTAANNGCYYRGGGEWVKGRAFPDSLARITLSGSANAQTGASESGVEPSDVEVFFAVVSAENTGSMTLSISGERRGTS